ncbi:hypothetical protein [Sphingobacterium cavernae]|uniref:hypothetical protein n=1 Tax=Sphingobacterium cavernae TaxID=2592657 RepID=UPI00123007BC|nr:hypothetical protein [Sphingobacterium cavernae]
MYIPFVQITISLFEELIERGYKYFILQRFEWVAVEHGKGFHLSAYSDQEEANTHAYELDAKEGKLLQMPQDYEKIIILLEVNSGYRIFLDRFKDADWEKRMLRLFKNNIVNYLRFNTRLKRKDPVEILFTLEYGRVWAIIESGGVRKKVKAYEIIK